MRTAPLLRALLALAVPGAAAAADPFPVAVSEDGRHVVNAAGTPFLFHGDTAWSLIAGLTREDADLYLTDRQRRGFNTILVSLIEKKFAPNAPANAYGEVPFLPAGDFSHPNPRYFDHARWVVSRAGELGLTVLLTPAYLGFGGGDQGWYAEMQAAGVDALRAYGLYVGTRFAGLDNIVWLHGGDHDPPNRTLVRAIVEGLAVAGDQHLAAAHGHPDTATADFWRGERWLDIDTVYTYGDVCGAMRHRYHQPQPKPVLMLETAYENEHQSTELSLRSAAYCSLLEGGAGHIFGNNPVWHVGGPGIYWVDVTWQEALDSRGAQSMSHLAALMELVDFAALRPTSRDAPIQAPDARHASLALSRDGLTAVAYLVAPHTVVLDGRGMRQGPFTVDWFDPSSGRLHYHTGTPYDRQVAHRLEPPSPLNDAGFDDWVLIVRAAP